MKQKGTSSNWGGKRANQTGRPKQKKDWSSNIKEDVLKNVKKKAKETGESFGAVLADMCWDKDRYQVAVRLGAAKLIAEILVVKESHQTVEKIEGPTIMLPALNPKPMPDVVVQQEMVH